MSVKDSSVNGRKQKGEAMQKTFGLVRLIILAMFFWFLSAVPARAELINLDLIKRIESNGNPKAFNKGSGAVGLYQITPICLADYNQFHNKKLSKDALWIPSENQKVASWYLGTRIPQLLRHYGKAVTVENVLTAYNAGIKFVGRKLPAETRQYIAKYKAYQSKGGR